MKGQNKKVSNDQIPILMTDPNSAMLNNKMPKLGNNIGASNKRIRCPICSTIFLQKNIRDFQQHFERCQTIKRNKNKLNDILHEIEDRDIQINNLNVMDNLEAEIDLLEKKNQRALVQPSIVNKFEDKVEVFRSKLKEMKIDWTKGCDTIEIERDHVINQSYKKFQTINPYKELKIGFKGEINQDAGGLIREWMNILFKEFFDEKMGIFQRAETDIMSYQIKTGLVKNQNNSTMFFFIGQLIGKALLENLTINCCFNKLIYKVLLEENISLKDLIFIDTKLYHSLKNVLKFDNIEELELYYSLQYETDRGEIKTEELVQGGCDIKVTNDNVDNYVFLRIDHLMNSQKPFIDKIRKGINQIIPQDILKQLTCDEFELVLNGTPFIDIEDWKESTIYTGYQKSDFVIVEFWKILASLTQDNLSHILQFATGSSRVPIGGFRSLEANRGKIAPFCISKCPYNKTSKNFIRAHTCFNRLDIPDFPNKTMLQNSITFLLKNEALGFGIE